ncbi:Poly(A)-specific ribonuclease PARN [Ananas comosus]|uniref:Poly(A)-specific ribonuclease PARN n=1 Tax=Ananas comosus TaxID=4615 RepID=A0A199VE10_ANACO|nr:Poly(A)-specific ribonuclease PARN [Ananas comosus]
MMMTTRRRSEWRLVWACSRTLTLTLTLGPSRPISSGEAGGSGGGAAVKKVTRWNFAEALEGLRARVREADFVAVDLEMTGVTTAPWRDAFEFDRPDVRYLKLRDSARSFAVVQLGVCPFRFHAATSSFRAHPSGSRVHSCSASIHRILLCICKIHRILKLPSIYSIWVISGISYLSRAQEIEALRKLRPQYEDSSAAPSHTFEELGDIPIVSTADLLFTERMKNRFTEWREGILRSPSEDSSEESLKFSTVQFQTVFFKMRPAIMLNGFSSHQLKLIQLILRKHFKDLLYVRTVGEDGTWQKRVVYTDSEEDKASLLKEVQEDATRSTVSRVRSAVGFRHVIDLLASEQKLIVGHNCLLDIAHIYNKFIGPLPSSMAEFVLAVHDIFPYVVDTKHLLNSSQGIQYFMKKKSKSLSSAFSLLCPAVSSPSKNFGTSSHVKVEVESDEAGSSCFSSGAKHEAGYDAFMTGCVFAQICCHLGVNFELLSPSANLTKIDRLAPYINLLYPAWNSGTVINLSTGTEKPEPGYKRNYPPVVFSKVTLVWGFPSKLKPKDLKESICKVFGPDSVTSIFFIDSTAALIQLSKEEFVNDFLLLKDTLERKDDAISVLHPLSVLLEGGNTRAGNYDTYRDICAASASKFLFADQADAVGTTCKRKLDFGSRDSAGSSETTEVETISPDVKRLEGLKPDPKKQSSRPLSCEDILDSLYASKSLLGKRMRSA